MKYYSCQQTVDGLWSVVVEMKLKTISAGYQQDMPCNEGNWSTEMVRLKCMSVDYKNTEECLV